MRSAKRSRSRADVPPLMMAGQMQSKRANVKGNPMQCEPVGLTEIAARLGVPKRTAYTWKNRGLLPEPRWTVSGWPAWNWPDIQSWAEEGGYPHQRPHE